MKVAFIHLLYTKALRISSLGGEMGSVLNLATNDSQRLFLAARFFNYSWAGMVFLIGKIVFPQGFSPFMWDWI
jgi:hypothetical protein